MNRSVLVWLLLLTCISGYPRQLFFSGYSITEGLSQSVVNCIYQDSKGYIWLGTQNGLNRFDGYSFVKYKFNPDDSTSISNNWIYSVAEDKNGNLWIGTKAGLNRYVRKERRFEWIQYSIPWDIDVKKYVYDVKSARNGKILINTPPVLSVCDPDNLSFEHYLSPLEHDGSVKDYNIPLLEDKDGTIWAGSTRGLACFNPSAKTFEIFTGDQDERGGSLSDNIITAICLDHMDNLWVGTFGGLNKFDRQKREFTSKWGGTAEEIITENLYVRSLTADQSGNLWAGTEGKGLCCININKPDDPVLRIFNSENSGINHNIVLSLLIDRTENLWAGTLSGVNKTDLKKQKFKLYRKSDAPITIDMAGNVIASLYKDEKNRIWIGHWGRGLDIYDTETGNTEHYSPEMKGRYYLPNGYVHSILKDTDENIWIGTRDGLLGYNPEDKKFVRPGQMPGNAGLPDLKGLRVLKMIQSRNGDYWIATQDGLYKKDHNSLETERFHTEAPPGKKISSNLIYALLEDREGFIWTGTPEGLNIYDPNSSTFKPFNEHSEGISLSDKFITALWDDYKGDIWIGTSSRVIKFCRKDSSLFHYNKDEGLPGDLVYSIIEDNSNRIWFATGNGLCSFQPSDSKCKNYSLEDGLQSLEFNMGASFKSSDGEIFLGGMNGFNSFYPDSITFNSYIPEPEFTSVYKITEGKREELYTEGSDNIVLFHDDHSFTVEFSALEFTNPAKNFYMYMLEGIDDDWIDIGNRNFIPFSNLSPGEYKLKVKCCNNDGLWNEKGTELNIVIRPPWWRSRLAWLSYLVLITFLILFFFKLRERQYLRYRKVLEEKVRERTLKIEAQKEEIVKKNAELNELNSSKDKFFSIIAHDLRNPFNAILGLTDLLLMDLHNIDTNKLKRSLENIKSSSQQAFELLENLLLWARSQTAAIAFRPVETNLGELVSESIQQVSILANRKNIAIIFEKAENIIIPVDPNMIRTVLRNLLTNAIKFTYQNGEVKVFLFKEGNNCIIEVADNGTGISPEKMKTLFRIDTSVKSKGTSQEPGTGLGLIICKELVERHDGQIIAESEEDEGSKFRIVLPIKYY
jgi:signal transduction histidine kinase/ligand-binding sensor domain-containing protein